MSCSVRSSPKIYIEDETCLLREQPIVATIDMRPTDVTPFIDNELIFGIDLVVKKTKRKTKKGQTTLEVISLHSPSQYILPFYNDKWKFTFDTLILELFIF